MGGRLALLVMLAVAVPACSHQAWQAEFAGRDGVAAIDRNAPFLKLHMVSGELVVLSHWRLDRRAELVHGRGLRYDTGRAVIRRGRMRVPFADVVLFETNRPRTVVHAGGIVLGVVGAITAGVAVFCALNPKACFGSCPTFYVDDPSGRPVLQAEGFSSAIARPFEDTDVDLLPAASSSGGPLVLEMRNEALETHVVESVRLLAIPRIHGRRIVRAGPRWFDLLAEAPPLHCRVDAADDCLADVRADDGIEWHTRADPRDLGAEMTLELELPPATGPQALSISARHSLVQTFVLYQFLAWVGSGAGEMYAAFERGGGTDMRDASRIGREVGSLHVDVIGADGAWTEVGTYEEVGPIARDRQVIPLPESDSSSPARVRLRMSRGWWRIDHLAQVALGPERSASALEPVVVRRLHENGTDADSDALRRLRAPNTALITIPGDAYQIEFAVPPGEHEIFLESRGYYYEWVRAEWLPEEDPARAVQFLLDPRGALRRLAPSFAEIEGQMDALFWGSRFGTPRSREPR